MRTGNRGFQGFWWRTLFKMQRPPRRKASPLRDAEPAAPSATKPLVSSSASEPRTPRGTDVIVRRNGSATSWLDSFLNAFHAAPIGFLFVLVLSFFTRFWQVRLALVLLIQVLRQEPCHRMRFVTDGSWCALSISRNFPVQSRHLVTLLFNLN